MNQSVVSEISSNLLFRYRIQCQQHTDGGKAAVELPVTARIPEFGSIEDSNPYAQLRASWCPEGMYFWLKIKGKKQSLWCKKTQLLESDGLQIWIDTRNTHNVHRATRFCHWFLFLPAGDGGDQKKPIATMLKINRAKEHSPTINRMPIAVTSEISKSGYSLAAFIPGATINGWDSTEHRSIGFNYIVMDRELGVQSLGVGLDFPVAEDPSLWSTLALTTKP